MLLVEIPVIIFVESPLMVPDLDIGCFVITLNDLDVTAPETKVSPTTVSCEVALVVPIPIASLFIICCVAATPTKGQPPAVVPS